ncbi:Nad dependent epimerase dehydratase [Lasiodiplodia theobromae]|uniref:Nad dependent epimerase dehydratase n=1 Tax=Lasiodiplodia theobromae TaxID=45133 RepID=UPI0015C3455D|nr:Nad dependent epimerase dehydratase [Lasiodiplodia theobromae]KAF4545937.1 Nad dependent epimerase dehydratase [Lasiodiplodia theobromae]
MTSSALNVLIVGANGYLGTAIGQAFLRTRPSVPSPPASTTTTAASPPPPPHFRVFGLVRRASAARTLAAQEVVPIIGSLSDDDPTALRDKILSHIAASNGDDNSSEGGAKPAVHVIAICTEPADRAARAKHWTDVLGLVQGLSASSSSSAAAAKDTGAGAQGKPTRPLVLWSSGCKDYGTTGLHGEPGLAPHTEDTPLAPHELVRGRADAAVKALESAGGSGGFDAVVLRATPICGYSGSLYGAGMEYVEGFAAAVKEGKNEGDDKVLRFVPPAGTVMHGLHVDDCADAYVAVAVTALFGGEGKRRGVVGQAFNISGRRYETLEEVGKALAKDYGFGGGAEFGVDPAALPKGVDPKGSEIIFGWSQWVDSRKIREATGWSDWRPLFSENVHAYRLAFEAAREGADENVKRIRERMAGNWGKE